MREQKATDPWTAESMAAELASLVDVDEPLVSADAEGAKPGRFYWRVTHNSGRASFVVNTSHGRLEVTVKKVRS